MALSSWVCSAEESVTARPSFSGEELKIILSHGPWPAPAAHDPTNRVSGKADAIELGTLLFFEQRLSGSGTKACASCHVPERN
jgi:cytochrome c peroxidase